MNGETWDEFDARRLASLDKLISEAKTPEQVANFERIKEEIRTQAQMVHGMQPVRSVVTEEERDENRVGRLRLVGGRHFQGDEYSTNCISNGKVY